MNYNDAIITRNCRHIKFNNTIIISRQLLVSSAWTTNVRDNGMHSKALNAYSNMYSSTRNIHRI